MIGLELGMAMRIFLAMRIDAYVGYIRHSAMLSDNAEVDADIRIRMAILIWNTVCFFNIVLI